MKSLIIILFGIQIAFTQNTNKIWYFGGNAGIDFKGGNAVALTNGALLSYDGSAAASDKNGDLLFYTNGVDVWNKNHQVMANGQGLFGSTNSMHSATIVPIIGQNLMYYIFTCADVGGPHGLNYSIVDMNLSGGLGAVTTKNIRLQNYVTEKVVAIPHANNKDYWVIAHQLESANFFVYLVGSNGVNFTSTVNIGSYQPGGDGAQGQITASPNGDKIAMASYSNDEFQLFDFNNRTGVISNAITLAPYFRAWGVEFSPDGKKLYCTRWTGNEVYQFDLNNYNELAINMSSKIIGNATGPDPNYKVGTLQLATDNKIYVAKWQSSELAVINNPNDNGLNCNFKDHGLNLSGKRSLAGLCNTVKELSVKLDPCDMIVQKSCLSSGMVKLEAQDINGQLIISKNRLRELLWSINDFATGTWYSIVGTNPIFVSNHAKFTITSKIYSWKNGLPHTIEFANICERKISDTITLSCIGPCDEFTFILSSCEDDYDYNYNLNYPATYCKSVCKNSCDYIVGIFDLNGNPIDPNHYEIKWSTGENTSFISQKGCVNYNLAVEVTNGECHWYGRYRPSCSHYHGFRDDPDKFNKQNYLNVQVLTFTDLNLNKQKFKIFNITGQFLGNNYTTLHSLNQGVYYIVIEDGINEYIKKVFISQNDSQVNLFTN